MDTSIKIDPQWAWEAYRPTAAAPWNLQRVGHLYRRAGFGANAAELEAGLKAGPDAAIAALLKGGPGVEEFDARMDELASVIARTNNGQALSSWWLSRMLYTPHPLREKITLFWHNHFATSNAKVQNARLMLLQYALLHKHALGNFAVLLREMSYDPAMLVWLDGRGSKKGNPNENYARELMELFSLGIGHYTEKDIREAARAFTGWELVGTKAVFRPEQHDAGVKRVLGKQGAFKPDDIVAICLEQPACARFVCLKLFRFLVSDTLPVGQELLEPLAERFRKSGYDFADLVKTVLSSNLFFSKQAYRSKIKSPVEFALGMVRALEGRIGTTSLAQVLEQLGQNLFHPPSVKGWDGGPAWLNGQTLLYRQNLALAFCSTEDGRFGNRLDPAVLLRRHRQTTDEQRVAFLLRLFLQDDMSDATRQRLLDYARQAAASKPPVYWTADDIADQRVRSLCHLVLSLPEYQLA